MLPLALFSVRNFAVGNIATFAIYAGLAVSSFLITVFVQQVGGYSAIMSGMALLPVTIIMFIASSRFGALAGRYGPRFFMAAGPFVAAIGFLLMLRVGQNIHYWTHLLPGVIVFGLGLSITVAPLTSAVLGAIPPQQAGIASAVNNAVSRIAGLIAIAALSLIAGNAITVGSFHRSLVAVAVLMFVGSAISALGIQNSSIPEGDTAK